ncbi:MAG TPA: SGNH/GDSL hydrolase family protein [Polyangiaceae bacterium]|nr:SGNH/GDSL hydrolase family protein [Polyangiaceae bacterium]
MQSRSVVKNLRGLGAPVAAAGACLALVVACSSTPDQSSGGAGQPGAGGTQGVAGMSGAGKGGTTGTTGGTGGSGGTSGTTSSGGTGTGGTGGGTGGSVTSGGHPGTGGSSMAGAPAAGTGGSLATGGRPGSGGGAGTSAGGRVGMGMGGAPTGGTSAAGSGAGGAAMAGSGGTSSGGFDPCPSTGPCKILPLGDSITWGINYGGGYRIKLFIHTNTDNHVINFVGYDTANPPSSSVLSGLGSGMSNWKPNHEGHSGWTIQQDDDLVTGKSTATNDNVMYTGKKVVADFSPNIVLVHLGTNDMYQMPTGAPDRLGTLIDHIVADAPNALVVVASIIPFPQDASQVMTFNAAVPGEVKTRADAGKHVIFVDMFSALTASDLGSDGIHPNEGGYEKMAVAWYGAIKSYLH